AFFQVAEEARRLRFRASISRETVGAFRDQGSSSHRSHGMLARNRKRRASSDGMYPWSLRAPEHPLAPERPLAAEGPYIDGRNPHRGPREESVMSSQGTPPPRPTVMKTAIAEAEDEVRLQLRSRQWGTALFLGIWLLGWTGGCLALAGKVWQEPSAFTL